MRGPLYHSHCIAVMTDTQESKLPRGAILGLIAGVIFLLGWLHLSFTVFVPALWGPYAFAFADAGPLVISRVGMMLVFVILPPWAIIYSFLHGRTLLHWAIIQLGTAIIACSALLGYGFYLHNIVNLQGLDASLDFFAMEVGFDSAAKVPANVKDAFVLSDKLASKGEAPWLPGAWKSVDWPASPAKQAR